MEELQRELERTLLMQGYEKDLLQASGSFERAINGNGTVLELPRGKRFFLETFNEVQAFMFESIESEIKKARKSKFYTALIEKQTLMYQKDMTNAAKYSLFVPRYENPITLLPYFITKELTKLMVRENIVLTVFCRKVANYYMQSYNFFGEASDDALTGVIQLVRSYVETTYCKYFETQHLPDGIIIKIKPEFSTLQISKEELLDTIDESHAAYKPMLVPPVPHNNLLDHDGGYLEIKSPVLKNPEWAEVRQYKFTAKNEGELFFETINKMQSTEWAVNTEFLEWMKQCKHPSVMKYFNNNINKMQIDLNKKTKMINAQITKLERVAKTSNYLSTQTTDADKRTLHITDALNANDEIDRLNEELVNATSTVGKARGWEQTLSDAKYFSGYEKFYHPVFCDNRGRVYTYNTSLSFQGNSLAKALIRTFSTERLTDSGVYQLQVLLGGMIEGFSKKSTSSRYNRVQELHEAFTKCIEHSDYSVIDLLDEDEVLQALNIMYTLYMYNKDSTYQTGILAYIDATSSAIQIQALVQKCSKAAGLTNLLPNSTDELPDAYKAVADTCKAMCTEIANQSDEEINTMLKAYYQIHEPERLNYMGSKG